MGFSEELFAVGDADKVSTGASVDFPIEGDSEKSMTGENDFSTLVGSKVRIDTASIGASLTVGDVDALTVVGIGLVVGECDGI